MMKIFLKVLYILSSFTLSSTLEIYNSNISMLLQEWGGDGPHEYLGAFRLEADQSWTPYDKLQQKDNDGQLIDKLLSYTSPAAAITHQ